MAYESRMHGMHLDASSTSTAGIVFGVFAALVSQLLFNLLGLGLGALATPSVADASAVSWSAFAWWAVTGIVSSFIGGWVAGWAAGAIGGSPGFHGVAMWAITTVIVAVGASLIASAGTALGYLAGPSFGMPPSATLANGDAEAARNAVAALGLGSFVALIIGGAAAYYGAQMGAAREVRLHPGAGQQRMI